MGGFPDFSAEEEEEELKWVVFLIFCEMGLKIPSHYAVAVQLEEKRTAKWARMTVLLGQGWQLKALVLWVVVVAVAARAVYTWTNAHSLERRKEILLNMCDERARMLQDQFGVSVNHVHALAILVSTFYYHKHPSAMDKVFFLRSPLSNFLFFLLNLWVFLSGQTFFIFFIFIQRKLMGFSDLGPLLLLLLEVMGFSEFFFFLLINGVF